MEKELMELKKLLKELWELEEMYHGRDIAQITIDLIQNIQEELNFLGLAYGFNPMTKEKYREYQDILGQYFYKAMCVLDVCDDTLIDKKILKDYMNIIKKYHHVLSKHGKTQHNI